jgi:hypothetical protein
MRSETARLRRERRTVAAMVRMYCRAHHDGRTMCRECSDLLAYAGHRLDRCPYGAEKPTCVNCPIHCYRPEPRERMREVMRWAGPRMLWRHPFLAIMHLVDGRRPPPQLPAARRSDNGAIET